jgi:hypothetical protein
LWSVVPHLRLGGATTPWRGANFDFTGSEFAAGTDDLPHARFTGGTVTFDQAELGGGEVHLQRCKFAGGTVTFTRRVLVQFTKMARSPGGQG